MLQNFLRETKLVYSDRMVLHTHTHRFIMQRRELLQSVLAAEKRLFIYVNC